MADRLQMGRIGSFPTNVVTILLDLLIISTIFAKFAAVTVECLNLALHLGCAIEIWHVEPQNEFKSGKGARKS